MQRVDIFPGFRTRFFLNTWHIFFIKKKSQLFVNKKRLDDLSSPKVQ